MIRGPQTWIRSSKQGRRLSRYNRWVSSGLVAIILVLAIALAWMPLPKPLTGGRDFFENLDRSLFTAAALALGAYFWFNFWTTHWATRELLKVAQQSPEQLFPHSPEAGMARRVFGRDRLVSEIADSLRLPGAGPQILVGGTGSGKTTVLLAVASHLATEHYIVPIVFNLRDESNDLTQKDFTELAFKRFKDLVDPYVRTDAEADKVWRWMCRRGRIVVLADDLDRSTQVKDDDPYRTPVRLALDGARRRKLPLVVTTRPSGLPPDLREQPINLSDYKLEGKADAATHVLEQAGQVGEADRGLVERNIEQGDLLENAFYIALLIRLLRVGMLDEPPEDGRHAVRLQLLEVDRRRLCGKGVLDKEEQKQREEALYGIEDLAAAWLVPTGEEVDQRWQRAVTDGERFDLLALNHRRQPQFKHEVLHAYYASKAIIRGSPWEDKLDQRQSGARVQLALVLTAAGKENEEFCARACELLLADVEGLNADQRLLRAAGAAELAKAGSFSGADPEIAQACRNVKADAGPVSKRAALEQLETVGGTDAVKALWEFAHDADYGTRWTAVECLVRRCSARTSSGGETIRPPVEEEAYKVLEPEIETALKNAAPRLEAPENKPVDDWDPEIVLLKQLAWMLPALRTGAKDPKLRGQIGTHLKELLRLECEATSPQYGLEASIAQGFKTDARLFPDAPLDRDAEEMLGRARFWYSQLNLVHALALRMAKKESQTHLSLRRSVIAVQRREREKKHGWKDGAVVTGDLHPMVRYAAKLCEDALGGAPADDEAAKKKRLKRVKRVVWEDEGVVVSRRPHKLDRAAAQLVGDITVLLNLNETGDLKKRRKFAEEVTLPHCLQGSRRRHELHDGCPKDCEFRLCPFHPVRDRLSAHREISGAFCRDQGRHARVRTARGWGARVTRRSLPEFWRRLEAEARY